MKTVIFIFRGRKGIADVETYRDRQDNTLTDRDIQGELGTDRDKQWQAGTSRDKQGQKETVLVFPCLVSTCPCPVLGIIGK